MASTNAAHKRILLPTLGLEIYPSHKANTLPLYFTNKRERERERERAREREKTREREREPWLLLTIILNGHTSMGSSAI